MDGDLVNDQSLVNRSLASPDNLHVWGALTLYFQFWFPTKVDLAHFMDRTRFARWLFGINLEAPYLLFQ